MTPTIKHQSSNNFESVRLDRTCDTACNATSTAERELDDKSMIQDQSLRSLAQDVIEMLKKTVGVEKFTAAYVSTQKVRAERKDERKQQKAFQAVSNPELAAKRKLKKNLNKITARKRKVEQYKPSKKAKKRKYQEFTIAE